MSLNRADILDLASDIEDLLEKKLGATGTGLHTKADSIAEYLDHRIIKKIHRIAAIRNAAAHEKNFSLTFEKEESFKRNIEEIKFALNNIGYTSSNTVYGASHYPYYNTNTNNSTSNHDKYHIDDNIKKKISKLWYTYGTLMVIPLTSVQNQ